MSQSELQFELEPEQWFDPQLELELQWPEQLQLELLQAAAEGADTSQPPMAAVAAKATASIFTWRVLGMAWKLGG